MCASDVLDKLGVYVPVSDDRPIEAPTAIPQKGEPIRYRASVAWVTSSPSTVTAISPWRRSAPRAELAGLEELAAAYVALSRYKRLPGSA
jgi:hypothetical protein